MLTTEKLREKIALAKSLTETNEYALGMATLRPEGQAVHYDPRQQAIEDIARCQDLIMILEGGRA